MDIHEISHEDRHMYIKIVQEFSLNCVGYNESYDVVYVRVGQKCNIMAYQRERRIKKGNFESA